MANLILLQKLM